MGHEKTSWRRKGKGGGERKGKSPAEGKKGKGIVGAGAWEVVPNLVMN